MIELEKILFSQVQKTARWKVRLAQRWPTIMGNFSRQIVLEKVIGDKAFLLIKNSCLAHEFRMQKQFFLDRCETEIGEKKISDFMVNTGSVSFRRKKENLPESGLALNLSPKDVSLTSHEILVLEKVKSSELKKALSDLLIRSKENKFGD